MVAVVEIEAVDIVMDGVEHLYLHTCALKHLQRLSVQAHHAAEIVKNQLDLHTLRCLFRKDLA